jgi:hypothetical protein
VLAVPDTTPVFTQAAATAVPPWAGRGPTPPTLRLVPGAPAPQTVQAVAARLPPPAWQDRTVAAGAPGPRPYQVVARRVWDRRAGLPARACWLRRTREGREARYYLSNAPEDTPLLTVAPVAAARGGIGMEPAGATATGETGLDEDAGRSWAGWHHPSTLALRAAALLLPLPQDGGEQVAPGHAAPRAPGAPGVAATSDVDTRRATPGAQRPPRAQRARQTVTQ